MVIRTALKREGLAGKVEVLPLGGLGPALTALAQGAVAAAPFNDPALTITPDKYKVLFYGHQYYPKFTWQVAVTTKEFAGRIRKPCARSSTSIARRSSSSTATARRPRASTPRSGR